MSGAGWRGFAALLVVAPLLMSAVGAQERPESRLLSAISGRVTAVELHRDAQGIDWVDAVVTPAGGGAPLRLRVAPADVLRLEEFSLQVDQRIQARIFSDETPCGVQKLRVRDTGRNLRLRSLHGEPLWHATGRHGVSGPAGPEPGTRHGPQGDRPPGRG
jgi:hypothetical protein